ncbi:VOC family protein [Paenibacillus rhizovicinus]|uniref:VOC family protein n=1 Tax=Paenibacillus rhizovicinus TaxID=2704463 RepID=A0A6C0PAU8_9BACL|nr:VOC family protein [Paenibacillus rhizovicinus]QHW33682.1 VOC family protein [Paenibacillus rhizovicinus]
MTQIARKGVLGNKNSDGYKPHRIPNALKVIHGQTNPSLEVVMMTNDSQLEETISESKVEDIAGITCLYIPVKNVYESVKWYEKNLRCEPTSNNPVVPGMGISIMRFPDHNGQISEAGLRSTVPALFLITAKEASYNGERPAIACFTTPRIQEMFNRFKENGVNIVTEIPEDRPCGPNFSFCDPDGNLFELWQP